MDTQVLTPQLIFMHPQRLVVPLFQRPYVWNRENQWEPLAEDLERVAERMLASGSARPQPHFLGAVVLQQVQSSTGSLQERTVIDGQQRLTTLQVLLDAMHAELDAVKATPQAMRVDSLVTNPEAFRSRPEDRFKVWPTNSDRPAFNAVMSAEPPVDYEALAHHGARLVEAHRFFAERIRAWLQAEGPEQVSSRAGAIERSIREGLQLVVIDLSADENAQEIFETLNARGAALTAADLIKNFVFQRLVENGVDVEAVYDRHWKGFETSFWEETISSGRMFHSRSSVFLNHWLIARTGKEIVAREVFARFKQYADFEAQRPMSELVAQLSRAAAVYRSFIEAASKPGGKLERSALFAYRTSVLESEVLKPLVLALFDPEQAAIEDAQLNKAFSVLESWLVRRMLVRATTKSYTQVFAELVTLLRGENRARAGDALEEHFRKQTVDSRYWPDDEELRQSLDTLPAYRRLSRGRLRMVLEAVEDHLRGWVGPKAGLGGERVARGQYAIEHLMPRKWHKHWPLTASVRTDAERDRFIHTLGNLTLLTGRLNSQVSNGPWSGDEGKRKALKAHDVLMLNRALDVDTWTDESIRARTSSLVEAIIEIWPVPEGHRSGNGREVERPRRRIELIDLIGAGLLAPGTTLYAGRKSLHGRAAVVLSDGRLDVDGDLFDSPSGAARAISGSTENGWHFFRTDEARKKKLVLLWRQYVEQLAVNVDDDVTADEDDES